MNDYYMKKQIENNEMLALFMRVLKWAVIVIILLLAAKGAMGADLVREIPVIKPAAARNGIAYGSDDWYLLLAIRMAENGKKYQFGILIEKAAYSLDLQAAWCAATIIKHHVRYGSQKVTDGYIESLAKRYCPVAADNDPAGLNVNWEQNVKYWFRRLKNEQAL